MKIKTIKPHKWLLFIFLFFLGMTVQAQEDLSIHTIFEKYGKQKGSTMVSLSGKALHNYKLDRYLSITLEYDKKVMHEIQQCLELDKRNARQIKEVLNNGIISSGYYQLEGKNTHRYILFKVGDDHTATLIYMEGGKDSEELINKLFIRQ